jgi:ribosomal protein L32
MALAEALTSIRVSSLGYLASFQSAFRYNYALAPLLQPASVQQQPTTTSLMDELLEPFVLMAVPKRRTSHSKKRMRMATKYLRNTSHHQKCPACGELQLRHHACLNCISMVKKVASTERKAANANLNKIDSAEA